MKRIKAANDATFNRIQKQRALKEIDKEYTIKRMQDRLNKYQTIGLVSFVLGGW